MGILAAISHYCDFNELLTSSFLCLGFPSRCNCHRQLTSFSTLSGCLLASPRHTDSSLPNLCSPLLTMVATLLLGSTGSYPGIWSRSCLVGEDASGHVAEETVSAKKAAAKGVFWATVASAICGFPIILVFLFCMPPIDTFYDTTAPQPFINMYAMALGSHAHVAATIISMIGAILNTSISMVAVSRLVFAIARDSVFPFSDVLCRVSRSKQPHNAVIFIAVIAALLLCTQLPSQVAFLKFNINISSRFNRCIWSCRLWAGVRY